MIETLAVIIGIVAGIVGILVFIIPALSSPESEQPVDDPTTIPVPPVGPHLPIINPSNFYLSADFVLEGPIPSEITLEWEHPDREVDKIILIAQLQRRTLDRDWGEWNFVGNSTSINVGRTAQGVIVAHNLIAKLCSDFPSADPTKEEYRVHCVLKAEKKGHPANPEFSNTATTEISLSLHSFPQRNHPNSNSHASSINTSVDTSASRA